jgi:hypothetical protein
VASRNEGGPVKRLRFKMANNSGLMEVPMGFHGKDMSVMRKSACSSYKYEISRSSNLAR